MESRRQFIALAALLLLIQFIFVGIDHYNLETTQTQILENVETANQAVEALDLARIAEARFKNQVQEWKNILLRGGEADLLERYSSAFEKEADLVQDALSGLAVLAESIADLDTARIENLMEQHTGMLAGYRTALDGVDLAEMTAARGVDSVVRGIDRAFTEELRVLATALAVKADTLTNEVSQNAVARLDAQKRAELVQLAIAGTIIVLLVIVFMVFGQRRKS